MSTVQYLQEFKVGQYILYNAPWINIISRRSLLRHLEICFFDQPTDFLMKAIRTSLFHILLNMTYNRSYAAYKTFSFVRYQLQPPQSQHRALNKDTSSGLVRFCITRTTHNNVLTCCLGLCNAHVVRHTMGTFGQCYSSLSIYQFRMN